MAEYEPVENYFDQFCVATSCEKITSSFERLCDAANLQSLPGSTNFYKELRQRLSFYWKAEALFANLDVRFVDPTYGGQTVCQNIQALVVGSGPCGLRTAIELALLGANVVVIDKRATFSRNNVLHLWPYLIHDLKSLGAKTFFGKFCAGSIDHICIRQLQCILLKVALLFGVQVVTGVEFQKLIPPSDDAEFDNGNGESAECLRLNGTTEIPLVVSANDGTSVGDGSQRPLRDLFTLFQGTKRARHGWRALFKPPHEALSTFEFDAIVDATGLANSCLDFPRKALRCRLAIAITVNFVNYGSVEEAQVEEISGVASIFHQPYFAQLSRSLGIELENLVYYKDETHYFVMTIKKRSLLAKGVLKRDCEDPAKLLTSENVNNAALQALAREVATFATRGGLKRLDFALNARGEPDVAVFDFTRLSAAQYACRITERRGRPLCQCLVGDALLEPFWPRGSGCALGFLGAMDAAWAVGVWAGGQHPLRVLAWRDALFQRLSQTAPHNMPPNFAAYSLLPSTRYTYVDLELVQPMQVRHLYDSDVLAGMTERKLFTFLRDSVKFEQPDMVAMAPETSQVTYSPHVSLLKWYQQRLSPYPTTICPAIIDLSAATWADGRALRCLLHKYRPELCDQIESENGCNPPGLERCMELFAKNFGAPSTLGSHGWPGYLSSLYTHLKDSEPAFVAKMIIRAPITSTTNGNLAPLQRSYTVANPTPTPSAPINRIIDPLASPRIGQPNRLPAGLSPRIDCRRVDIRKLQRDLQNPSAARGAVLRKSQSGDRKPEEEVEAGLLSKRRSQLIAMLNDPASAKRRSLLIDWERAFQAAGLPPPPEPPKALLPPRSNSQANNAVNFMEKSKDFCVVCKKALYAAESRAYDGFRLHPRCFRCVECQRPLRPDIVQCTYHPTDPKFYCTNHFDPQATPTTPVKSNAGKAKMPTHSSVASKPRTHNAPSLFCNLANPVSPSRSQYSNSGSTVISDYSNRSIQRHHNHRHQQLASSSGSAMSPQHIPRRRWSAIRGIRDEPAPPVLLTSAAGSLGLPECVRRAAFDERLYRLNGCIPPDDFLSETTSRILDDETDNCFASSESDQSSYEVIAPIRAMSNTTSARTSPPISIEEATQLCRIKREESLYRRHHPPRSSSSASSSSPSSTVSTSSRGASSISDTACVRRELDSDEEDEDESKDITEGTFDTPQPFSEYENARWTLVRPPPTPEPSTSNAQPGITPLAQKYGLSGSLLLAKQRFCLAEPQPIRIDSKAFRASRNKERTTETTLSDCTESVGLFPDTHEVFAPCTVVGSPLSESQGVQIIHPSQMTRVTPRICEPSSQLGAVEQTVPIEPWTHTPYLPLNRTESIASTVVSEDYTAYGRPRSPVRILPQNRVRRSSTVLSDRGCDSTVVSECVRILVGNPTSQMILTSSSEEEDEEEEEEEGMEFLHRALVVPPEGLAAKVKEGLNQTARRKSVPLYILTSKLDSDDDEEFGSGKLVDPQDVLEDEEDSSETSTQTSEDEAGGALPPISEAHAKEITALKARLADLDEKMRELELQCSQKKQALRALEASDQQVLEEEGDLAPQAGAISEPDLSVNLPSKREPRWKWSKSRRPHSQSTSSRPSLPSQVPLKAKKEAQPPREMTERSEKARLFADLLSVISQRNRLVTQEAVIMAELKKIELEAYEESLQQAYDSLQGVERGGEAGGKSKLGAFLRHKGDRVKRERIYPVSRAQEVRGKKLLDEIWKVSKEKTALTAVQGETMERASTSGDSWS